MLFKCKLRIIHASNDHNWSSYFYRIITLLGSEFDLKQLPVFLAFTLLLSLHDALSPLQAVFFILPHCLVKFLETSYINFWLGHEKLK